MHVDDPAIANLPLPQAAHSVHLTVAQYFPAWHAEQAMMLVAWAVLLAVPALHDVQVVAPASEYWPLSHAVQEAAPAATECVPASHFCCCVWSALVLKPAPASVQDDAPPRAYCPLAQLSQPVASAFDFFPATHVVQLRRLVTCCFPAAQCMHAEAPATENCPGPQEEQKPDPAEAENLPATHCSQSLWSVFGISPA